MINNESIRLRPRFLPCTVAWDLFQGSNLRAFIGLTLFVSTIHYCLLSTVLHIIVWYILPVFFFLVEGKIHSLLFQNGQKLRSYYISLKQWAQDYFELLYFEVYQQVALLDSRGAFRTQHKAFLDSFETYEIMLLVLVWAHQSVLLSSTLFLYLLWWNFYFSVKFVKIIA